MVHLRTTLSSLLVLFPLLFLPSFIATDEQKQQSHLPQFTPEFELRKAQSLVETVNSKQKKWRAKVYPRFAAMSDEQRKTQLLGLGNDPEEHRKLLGQRQKTKKKITRPNRGIPDHFDAREQWPMCRDVISQIQNQGGCGSCWAVSVASVIQDRICISSGGRIKVNISSEDLISCNMANHGCAGGRPELALKYWQESGLCTGSNFTLQSGCKPYQYPPYIEAPIYDRVKSKCQKRCKNKNYEISYRRDKHFGKSYTHMIDADVEDIQMAIIAGGPVEANMLAYDDFYQYLSGIYRHVTGEKPIGHAIRIIGWGVGDDEDKTPYWLGVNSWSADWGDNGYFRIARNEDECWIESWGINYGEPNLWI